MTPELNAALSAAIAAYYTHDTVVGGDKVVRVVISAFCRELLKTDGIEAMTKAYAEGLYGVPGMKTHKVALLCARAADPAIVAIKEMAANAGDKI